MVTPELISYIRNQLQKGIDKELIISWLVGAGWKIDDVHEGFLSVDLYHEPVEGDIIFNIKNTSPKEEKVEPQTKDDNLSENANITGGVQITEDKVMLPEIKPEILEEFNPQKEQIIKKDISNVWIPKNIPTKLASSITDIKKPISPVASPIPVKSNSFVAKLVDNINSEKISIPNNSNVSNNSNRDFLKSNIQPVPAISYNIPNNVSKIAMLSSYKNDLISVSKKGEDVPEKKSRKIKKAPIIILIIVLLTFGLLSWLYFNGNLKLNFNILNLKKDPKTLLLNNSKKLASLDSYKTETNINISFPTFANIVSGLVTGEAVESNDKDTILINSIGLINKDNQSTLSDDFITLKGTLVPSYITMDIKRNNNSSIYVAIPDISSLTDEFVPSPKTVVANEEEFTRIISLLSGALNERFSKINLYRVLSSGIPSYINNDVLNSYNDLINNVDIIDKGTENIKGIDTYHYSIVVDRQLYKDLLNKISSNLVAELSKEDQFSLNQLLNSTTVDSFDVWVGKNDNNIYQYNVVINIPLSQIVDFKDKSIGNNMVSISWKTTYYDFDIQNNIFMPTEYISTDEFIKEFNTNKIKNDVITFKKLSNDLFNIEKSYGKSSNISGNCMKPTPGSLFSPSGHSSNATSPIGDISFFLNNILAETNNNGFCYSTTKSWSLTIPISDDYGSAENPKSDFSNFFCVDSTGAEQELSYYPKSDVCVIKEGPSVKKTSELIKDSVTPTNKTTTN